MPDNVYFRQPATQNMMLDILFVWCKMNPDVGYRQGMHEVLAPILWVVERDAVDTTETETDVGHGTLLDMVDSVYIEHDSFSLFTTVMTTAKSFYAPAETGSSAPDSPMLTRSARIFERYLPRVDPGLSTHLVKLEILPQIFLLYVDSSHSTTTLTEAKSLDPPALWARVPARLRPQYVGCSLCH